MRAYYTDSYTRTFQTQITDTTQVDGKPAVILENSFFYPTSGGQPHDLGTLDDVPVLEVMVRPQDNLVLHILEKALSVGKSVTGQIEWTRRFDHMQHHTGQHILSRAFEDLHDAQTIGFHLSENSVTIDLDKDNLSPDDLIAAEDLANRIVFENHAVRAWFPSEDDLAGLALRKISDKVVGDVRVVDIEGFDVCACGGTHVAYTGEIGMIKIIRTEKMKGAIRVEFRCGNRALLDYREKNNLLLSLAADMTISYREVPEAVTRIQNEAKSLGKSLKGANTRLLQYEAEELWNAARAENPDTDRVVFARIWEDREIGDLNTMMQYFIRQPRTVALMALPGDKAYLIFGCSEDLKYDVVPLLKAALETLGSKSGGGRPTLAQGGGFKATVEQLESIFQYAKARALRGE